MNFPFNIYLLSALAAAAVSILTLPFWIRLCRAWGLVDDPGHRKVHDRTTPLAGGLAVMTGFFLPFILGLAALQYVGGSLTWLQGLDLSGWAGFGVEKRTGQFLVIGLGALAMLVLGLIDDRWELSPILKFTGQCLIASAVALAGVRVTLFVDNAAFSFLVTVLWVLTITNAFNFLDNMNGLCAGIGAIAAWAFAWAAAVQGQYLAATVAFAMVGALLGFLPFNFPSASAFLGDAGSHLVGFLVGILAILPDYYSTETPARMAVLKPLVILAVPLVDLAQVVILRWRTGRPFYMGDTNHLSHRLTRIGWSRRGAVLLLWLAGAVGGALALGFY